jgi:flagellar hook protein FlgE
VLCGSIEVKRIILKLIIGILQVNSVSKVKNINFGGKKMLQSLYSGISGLKAEQRELDVIGNNIANSSTTAFKSQRIRFEDMVSQNLSQAVGGNANTGGVNGEQVGLGVQVAGIDTDTSAGSMQSTSKNLDFAVDGTGYFVVGSGAVPSSSPATAGSTGTITANSDFTITPTGVTPNFTRDGSFSLDSQGNLLTSNGLRVYGYQNTNAPITYSTDLTQPNTITIATANTQGGADPAIDGTALVPLVIPDSVTDANGTAQRVQSFSVGNDGLITAVLANGTTAALGQIAMTSFKNEGGLTSVGNNDYVASANSGNPIVRSSNGTTGTDNSKGYGNVLQGMLEMSNVDLAQQFSDMIVASRAFQANGKIITTGDQILQTLINLKQ